MKVGILTGGGDCPGLNAVIRAAGRRVMTRGGEVVGVLEGWKGLVEGLFEPLGPREISGLLPRGGTILRTTRTNPFKVDGGVEKVLANFQREGFDALVAIGGEDTLGVAARLHEDHGFPVVGVPKTIDNDLSATDYTFGFDTAVWVATGWIAVVSGIAGGADMILIPEQPVSIEDACKELRRRHERGKDFSIVVVSEGYELEGMSEAQDVDQFGHVSLSERGVGARYGLKAADLVEARKFGRMAALHGDEIVDVSLAEATAELKTVPAEWWSVAQAFFG